MLRKILFGIALLVIFALGAGFYLMHRFESRWNRESQEQLSKLVPGTIVGGQDFSKALFYSNPPNLGAVTQILEGWPADREGAALTLVGNKGVDFLDANAKLKKEIRFSESVQAPVQAVRVDSAGEYGFLTRDQTWATDVILFDKSGEKLWSYPEGFSIGVDDSAAGDFAEDGKLTVVVGFNGGGGIVLINSQGKQIWKQSEGNVWHVEALDVNRNGRLAILHSDASGQLLVRNSSGEVMARYLPGYYVSNFSLTRWGDEPQATHILVPAGDTTRFDSKRAVFVLDASGKIIASFAASGGTWADKTSGAPILRKSMPPLYAVVQTGNLPRSVLSIYANDGKILYKEILSERCLAINTLPGPSGDHLLVGCRDSVWEYGSRTEP